VEPREKKRLWNAKLSKGNEVPRAIVVNRRAREGRGEREETGNPEISMFAQLLPGQERGRKRKEKEVALNKGISF